MPDPREPLGRLVHDIRLATEAERATAEGRPRFFLGSWEERSDHQRELDMRIGAAVAQYVTAAAEAKLGAIEAHCRDKSFTVPDGPREVSYVRVSGVLAIIGSEEEVRG